MLLLLEETRIERKKTWLIDIVTIVEILIVALMHILLVEILTMLFHIKDRILIQKVAFTDGSLVE